MKRPKNNTELLDRKAKEDDGFIGAVSDEMGVNLLTQTIANPDFDYVESLKAFRIFIMLRMNKNNDIYSKQTVATIYNRYRLALLEENEKVNI